MPDQLSNGCCFLLACLAVIAAIWVGKTKSLGRTKGRPLCPQCRAPLWNVALQPEKAAYSKRTFQCPRCEVVVLEATAERKFDPVAACAAIDQRLSVPEKCNSRVTRAFGSKAERPDYEAL